MDTHFFLPTDFFFIHRDVLEINRLDKIARRSKRLGGAIADLWGSHFTIRLVLKNKKCCCCSDFFFTRRGVLEINRLDKFARRSKRLGGAIADLWGSHYVLSIRSVVG